MVYFKKNNLPLKLKCVTFYFWHLVNKKKNDILIFLHLNVWICMHHISCGHSQSINILIIFYLFVNIDNHCVLICWLKYIMFFFYLISVGSLGGHAWRFGMIGFSTHFIILKITVLYKLFYIWCVSPSVQGSQRSTCNLDVLE